MNWQTILNIVFGIVIYSIGWHFVKQREINKNQKMINNNFATALTKLIETVPLNKKTKVKK